MHSVQDKPDLMPKEIWSILENMVSQIKSVQAIPLRTVSSTSNLDTIQVTADACDGSLPVVTDFTGCGSCFNGDSTSVHATGHFPADADCLVHIQRTFMESIPNNSYAATRRVCSPDAPRGGFIYFCSINDGEIVCKKYIEEKSNGKKKRILKSLTSEIPDIQIEEDMRVHIYYMVICKDRINKPLIGTKKVIDVTPSSDMSRALLDCTEQEEQIIIRTVEALKAILFEFGI